MNVVIEGDSFSNQTASTDWPAYLEGHDIVSRAGAGDTLQKVASELGTTLDLNPYFDVAVVIAGVNDVNQAGGVSPHANMVEAAESVFAVAEEYSSRTFIFSNAAPFGGYANWNEDKGRWIAQYNAWWRYKRPDCPSNVVGFDINALLDQDGDGLLDDEFDQGDGIHPSETGARLIAARIEKLFLDVPVDVDSEIEQALLSLRVISKHSELATDAINKIRDTLDTLTDGI